MALSWRLAAMANGSIVACVFSQCEIIWCTMESTLEYTAFASCSAHTSVSGSSCLCSLQSTASRHCITRGMQQTQTLCCQLQHLHSIARNCLKAVSTHLKHLTVQAEQTCHISGPDLMGVKICQSFVSGSWSSMATIASDAVSALHPRARCQDIKTLGSGDMVASRANHYGLHGTPELQSAASGYLYLSKAAEKERMLRTIGRTPLCRYIDTQPSQLSPACSAALAPDIIWPASVSAQIGFIGRHGAYSSAPSQ